MKNIIILNKSICFVLPGFSRHEIGGYKVVYEYANRLIDFNYDVTIFYPLFYLTKNKSESLIHVIKKY